MLRMPIVGLHTTTKQLASGDFAIYAYLGRNGPQLCSATGRTLKAARQALEMSLSSKEVLKRYSDFQSRLVRPNSKDRQIFHSVAAFYDSPEWASLSRPTAREYRRYLEVFRAEFATFTVKKFEDPELRGDLHEWRNYHWKGRRRASDFAIQSVSAFFKWARSQGWTTAAPTASISRLHKSNRSKNTWKKSDLSALFKVASKEVRWVVELAAYTGIRQGDLLNLSWSMVHEDSISIVTAKSGRVAVIPLSQESKDLLGSIPVRSPTVLLNSYGRPWTSDGFRSSFAKARNAAGIKDLDFHDLRGTAVTNLRIAGADDADISRIVGWSIQSVRDLLAIYENPDVVALDMVQRMKQKRPLTNR